MAKTLICINTLTAVEQFIYSNHMNFFFRLGRNCPDDNFVLFTPRRMTIDRCRNEAVKIALKNEIDYILFVDDDVLIPPLAYQMLKAHDKDVVAGWTVIRGYPFNNMHFKYQGEGHKSLTFYNDHEETEGLIEVDAVGCSCVLFKTEIFKNIPPPYFITGTHNTEDIYLCVKAKEYNPDLKIFVDLSVKTGHILGNEVITPQEKALWKEFEEKRNPDVKKDPNDDRGDDYLERMKAAFGEGNA